jgi:surface protein
MVMNYYRIAESTMQNIADEVRKKRLSTNKYNAVDISAEISKITTPIPINVTNRVDNEGVWHRPDTWPDLDSLDRSTQVLYLTYDNVRDDVDKFFSLRVSVDITSAGWDIEIGTVTDGVFTAYESAHVANDVTYGRLFTESDPDYPVVRVTSTSDINLVWLTPYPTDSTARPRFAEGGLQPCVERYGYLPYVTQLGSTAGTTTPYNWRAYYLERENVKVGDKLKSLANAWNYCYSLQSLDISDYDVSNVITLAGTWSNCRSLQLLDIGNWDVSNVTNLSSTWQNCYVLRQLDISDWDVSNVTTLADTWSGCMSLRELNVGNWDVHNVSTLNSTWSGCASLKNLDIGNWDVSNVLSLAFTWSVCQSLRTLDVGNWNVSNVTNTSYALQSCCSLQSLDISNWDVGNATNMSSMFTGTTALKKLKLPHNINQSVSIRNSDLCSHDMLVDIINNLPETSSALTLNMSYTNLHKLTSDEIAVANTKGWTIA